jgi:hypothetical protein
MSGSAEATRGAGLDARAWKLTALYTLVAAGVYWLVRTLPLASGSLHYTDFHAGEKTFLEFCAPGTPQFAPVDRVRSPVTMSVVADASARAGETVRGRVVLTASSGRPVTVDDLVVVHTEKLHLLVVDPSLDDYHHLHPTPTGVPGEFAFEFTPARAGRYRFFGDFTPRATGRALYTGAALEVAAGPGRAEAKVDTSESFEAFVGDYVFRLSKPAEGLHINQPGDLGLSVARRDGGTVLLEEIMDARAHLVAFDEACTGFAHLHPLEAEPIEEGAAQKLGFTLLLTDPGYYRLWAQVKLDGREVYAPFGLSLEP